MTRIYAEAYQQATSELAGEAERVAADREACSEFETGTCDADDGEPGADGGGR